MLKISKFNVKYFIIFINTNENIIELYIPMNYIIPVAEVNRLYCLMHNFFKNIRRHLLKILVNILSHIHMLTIYDKCHVFRCYVDVDELYNIWMI